MQEPEISRKIKQALRDCESARDVQKVAEKYRPNVEVLKRVKETRVFAIHISNLKELRMSEFRAQMEEGKTKG